MTGVPMRESRSITLRRHENRRLYDVDAAKPITVEQARDRLLHGEGVFTPTGCDVTAQYLVMLISRDQKKGKLTSAQLLAFLRSYLT